MKSAKKIISILLVGCIFTSIPAQASVNPKNFEVLTLEDNSEVKVTSVEVDNNVITAEYNKKNNEMMITTTTDGNISEQIHIDLNQGVEDRAYDYTLFAESDGRYRVSYEHTILDYEYEQWKYPNYNNGKEYFWFLKKPGVDSRPAYEEVRGGSVYSSSIDGYVEAVEVINSKEIIVGASGMITVAAIIATGGTASVVIGKIVAALQAIGVVAAVTVANELYQAVQDCNRYWTEIYG